MDDQEEEEDDNYVFFEPSYQCFSASIVGSWSTTVELETLNEQKQS